MHPPPPLSPHPPNIIALGCKKDKSMQKYKYKKNANKDFFFFKITNNQKHRISMEIVKKEKKSTKGM